MARPQIVRISLVLGLFAALAVVLSACGGSTRSAARATPARHGRVEATAAEHVNLVIKSDTEHGKKGSDGQWHDAYLPANFTVQQGDEVVVTVRNYDDMPHTFTAPGLKVSAVIPKGSETKAGVATFTFTASKAGSYLWWCALPCDPWSMSHLGFMRGHVTVA